jgi:peptidoglycan/LPS O-acetylase OafA/YrhL
MADRIGHLDSLRGLAALTVLSQHALMLLPDHGGWLWRAPFYNGREAVILFFVLSGFVLYLPWAEGKPPAYGGFWIRRICRIYLPYMAAIGCSALAMAWVGGHPAYPVQEMWMGPSAGAAFLVGLDLLGTFEHAEGLLPVAWSLVVEARASLLFPLAASCRPGWLLAAWALLDFGVGPWLGSVLPWIQGNFWFTLHYGGMFVLGMWVARERAGLVAAFGRLGPAARLGVVALALGVLYKHLALTSRLVVWAPGLSPTWQGVLEWQASEALAAVGVAALLVAVMGSPRVAAALERRPLLWLGRVSYSLYLFHMPVLAGLAHLLAGRLPLPAVAGLGVLGALAVAGPAHHLIERPAIALGRRLTRRAPAPAVLVAAESP